MEKEYSFPLKGSEISEIDRAIYTLKTEPVPDYMGSPLGISSPQLGIDKRFIILRPSLEKFWVFLNPKIVKILDETTTVRQEGCLSIVKELVEVERVNKIQIWYQDIEGKEVEETMDDFACCAFLHEYDHLEGILMTDDDRALKVIDKNDEYREWKSQIELKRKKYNFIK